MSLQFITGRDVYKRQVWYIISEINIQEDKVMIITTTPSIEGKEIREYRGIVFGEVVSGVNFVKDFAASLSDMFGGRSSTYEEELVNARTRALAEMEARAVQLLSLIHI